jgi:hypothetical protein
MTTAIAAITSPSSEQIGAATEDSPMTASSFSNPSASRRTC